MEKQDIEPDFSETRSSLGYIVRLAHRMNDPTSTGWIQQQYKNDLWCIKFAVDQALKNAPNFSGEPPYEELYMLQKVEGKV